jgi:hypothetical protein
MRIILKRHQFMRGSTNRTQRPRKWPSGYVVSDVGPCSAAGNGAAGIDTAEK